MYTCAKICTFDNIFLDVPIHNQQQLFRFAAEHLQHNHVLDAEKIFCQLQDRENMGSTALGQGMAIPHSQCAQLKKPLGMLIRTSSPIDFDAPDGKPVDIFFLLLVPNNATHDHLNLLADIAGFLCEPDFRQGLRASVSGTDVRQLLLEYQKIAA